MRLLILLVSSAAVALAACGDGEISADPNDAGGASDADPLAPDADPLAPDADPLAPDAAPPAAARCGPLAPPSGATVTVSPGESIASAVRDAAPGTTILLADGTYDVSGEAIWFDAAGITLRSASDDRDAVTLDGAYANTGSGGVLNIRADDVTIASIGIRRSRFHAIHVTTDDGGPTLRTRIHDVAITDPGEQAIKINSASAGNYADDGEVACSRIVLTRTGADFVTSQAPSGLRCYTGGIDAHGARGWGIRDNWIEGFWCAGAGGEYLSEHAVHFWTGSRDTVVEGNRLVDNTRGVGFGLGPGGRGYDDAPCGATTNAGHYGGVVRNNFITATEPALFASANGVQEGISLSSACDATVLHNTIVFTNTATSAIEWRFAETSGLIANNLATHRLWDRGVTVQLDSNLADQPATGFVDVGEYDLHLTADAAAIGVGSAAYLASAPTDIDGDARDDGAPDVGADER